MGRASQAQMATESSLAVLRAMEERAKDRPATEQQYDEQVGRRTVLEAGIARNAEETAAALARLLAAREDIAQRAKDLERVAADEQEAAALQDLVTARGGKVDRF